MATAIQAIYIRGHEERSEPKPHTVYRIEIHTSVRSWQMWRRYSEFVDLDTELTKSAAAAPPAKLPPKHSFSLRRTFKEDTIIKERLEGLEKYLRAILSHKDDKWRESFAFRDFLGVPVGKADVSSGGIAGAPSQFTSSSWLDEQMDLQTLLRDIRADLNKRDALANRNDVNASHTANVQAKKKLAGLVTRVGALAVGLESLGLSGMSEGELQRRGDMVARLQDDCEKLGKMVAVARQNPKQYAAVSAAATAADRNPAPEAQRAALLHTSSNRPITRVFGARQPQETEQTRPLDEQGLLQLQVKQMEQQDSQLSQLSAIIRRQKQLGLAISSEIELQNELLDDLGNEVDRVGGKLGAAKKQMNRLG